MSILLPSTPGARDAVPGLIDFGGILRPILGGEDQKLNRIGTRMGADFTMPEMKGDDALAWIAALAQAQLTGAIMDWPQPLLVVGAPGSPVVDTAGQAGSSLKLRQGAANYAIRIGQFFSLIHGGRRYLHMVTGARTFSAGGIATVPIVPMLRVQPSDGAVVEMAAPKFEGFLSGNRRDWNLNVARTAGLQFRIEEAA